MGHANSCSHRLGQHTSSPMQCSRLAWRETAKLDKDKLSAYPTFVGFKPDDLQRATSSQLNDWAERLRSEIKTGAAETKTAKAKTPRKRQRKLQRKQLS